MITASQGSHCPKATQCLRHCDETRRPENLSRQQRQIVTCSSNADNYHHADQVARSHAGSASRSPTGDQALPSGSQAVPSPASANNSLLRSCPGGGPARRTDDPQASLSRMGKAASRATWGERSGAHGKHAVRATMESIHEPDNPPLPGSQGARHMPVGFQGVARGGEAGLSRVGDSELPTKMSGPSPKGGAIRSTVPSLLGHERSEQRSGHSLGGLGQRDGADPPHSKRSRQETESEAHKTSRVSTMLKSFVLGPRAKRASATEQPSGSEGLPLVYFKEFEEVSGKSGAEDPALLRATGADIW